MVNSEQKWLWIAVIFMFFCFVWEDMVIRGQNGDLEKKLIEHEERIKDVENVGLKSLQEVNDKLGEVLMKADGNKSQFEQLEDNFNSHAARIDGLEARINDNEDNIKGLEEKFSGSEARIDVLGRKIIDLDSNNARPEK